MYSDRPFSYADFLAKKVPPHHWDCADAIEDGWTKEEIKALMQATAVLWTPGLKLPRPSREVMAKAAPASPQPKETPVVETVDEVKTPAVEPRQEKPKPTPQAKPTAQAKPDNVVPFKAKPKPEEIYDAADWRAIMQATGDPALTLEYSEKGIRPGSIKNWRLYLQYHPDMKGRLAFNWFTDQTMMMKPFRWEKSPKPRTMSEHDGLAAIQWLEGMGLTPKNPKMILAIMSQIAMEYVFNPAQDYMRRLVWDGESRLDTLMHKGLVSKDGDDGTELGRYVIAAGRAFMISAVARTMQPGCKVDTMLVLEGAQGIGKSTGMADLTPEIEWFSDQLPHDVTTNDAKMLLATKMIVEMPEINPVRKSETNAMKQFLSAQNDEYRRPHAQFFTRKPRQCVFVGTTNESEYLADRTGNRRYWPVRLTGVDRVWLQENRDQLWAEAYAAYETGESWWLSDDVHMTAMSQQAERVDDDVWLAVIGNWLRGDGYNRRHVSTADVLTIALNMQIKDTDFRHKDRVRKCMLSLGYDNVSTKVGGIAVRTWKIKANPQEEMGF